MNSHFIFVLYLFVGSIGGLCGYKLKIPAGALVGAMVFVIGAKLILKSEWTLPRYIGFGVQILLGGANKDVFRETDGCRFFLTGDVGSIDKEGYTTITDRKKDLILVGGFNCYPGEVEEVLYGYEAVENAVVVGIPDEKSGECPVFSMPMNWG